jgi:outer membrane lipoprotein
LLFQSGKKTFRSLIIYRAGGKKMNRGNGMAWVGLVASILFVTLAACAPISKSLRSEAVNIPFSAVQDEPRTYKGSIVIWGGEIIRTENRKKGTTLVEVMEKPLGWREKPELTDESQGRFLVTVNKFLDPRIYRPGRRITVAGEVAGSKTKLLGKMKYRYPLLSAKQIYLWPKHYYYYYNYPYWGYYGYYGPGWYGPWWGGGPWWGYGGIADGDEVFESHGGFGEHGEGGEGGEHGR